MIWVAAVVIGALAIVILALIFIGSCARTRDHIDRLERESRDQDLR